MLRIFSIRIIYTYIFIHSQNIRRIVAGIGLCSGYRYCFVVARGAMKSEVRVVGVTVRGETRSRAWVYCFISVPARATTFTVIRSSPASIAQLTSRSEHVQFIAKSYYIRQLSPLNKEILILHVNSYIGILKGLSLKKKKIVFS